MHEYAIAESVLGVVLDHAGGRRVTRVQVRVGHLRQVVPSALTFSFEIATRGTPAEAAELVIEAVEAAGRCRQCGAESLQPAFPLHCEACGGFDLEVIRGEELLVEWIELEDEEA